VRRVNSKNLTREQLAIIQFPVLRQLRYLGKLRDRMNRLGFMPDDELWQAATRAFNAVHELRMRIHYLSCPGGVG
jgi:hypothetical protein